MTLLQPMNRTECDEPACVPGVFGATYGQPLLATDWATGGVLCGSPRRKAAGSGRPNHAASSSRVAIARARGGDGAPTGSSCRVAQAVSAGVWTRGDLDAGGRLPPQNRCKKKVYVLVLPGASKQPVSYVETIVPARVAASHEYTSCEGRLYPMQRTPSITSTVNV
jgi:hypothetical protein